MKAADNKILQAVTVAFTASSLFLAPIPSIAKEGEAPKMAFFGIGSASTSGSSPYVQENREDPIYSPYSPYGNGEKSLYNKQRKGTADELKFWKNKFESSR